MVSPLGGGPRIIPLDRATALPPALRGGVAALGNFDGVHRGHQAVVGAAVARARAEGRPALVATFDPHPVRFFRPDAAPFRLTSLDQRAALFAAMGVEATLVFAFDARFAALTAEAFIATELVDRLGLCGVVTGQDFTFGKGRGGSARLLAERGRDMGLTAQAIAPIEEDGAVVSSSRIRDALTIGDCAQATALLTRPYAVTGMVRHGDKRGRTLGFPTANLELADWQRPAFGVYAVTATLPDGRVCPGVASLGIRPMFTPAREGLETHIFDFDGDLYGRDLTIAFHHWLRPEARFADLDALVRQMHQDAARARILLQTRGA